MHSHEVQNILSGTGGKKPGDLIQTVAQKLAAGKKPGDAFEKDSLTKQQEEKILNAFAATHNL